MALFLAQELPNAAGMTKKKKMIMVKVTESSDGKVSTVVYLGIQNQE